MPETREIGILGAARCANELKGMEGRVSHSPTYGNVRDSPTRAGLAGCQRAFSRARAYDVIKIAGIGTF